MNLPFIFLVKHPCFHQNNSIFTINHQSSPTSNGHVTSIFPRTLLQQAIYFPQKSNMSLPFEKVPLMLIFRGGVDHVRSPRSALNPLAILHLAWLNEISLLNSLISSFVLPDQCHHLEAGIIDDGMMFEGLPARGFNQNMWVHIGLKGP